MRVIDLVDIMHRPKIVLSGSSICSLHDEPRPEFVSNAYA